MWTLLVGGGGIHHSADQRTLRLISEVLPFMGKKEAQGDAGTSSLQCPRIQSKLEFMSPSFHTSDVEYHPVICRITI